jgi:alpha-glucosidase
MQELRAVIDQYEDRFLVGETEEISYHGNDNNELHMVFNFPLLRTERLTPAWIRANQKERLSALPAGAWPSMTLGNHDSPRVYSRYGDGEHDDALARLHLAVVLTLPGTPFLYNGEEIGMGDWWLTDMGQFRDNLGLWQYRMATAEFGDSAGEALAIANRFSRDKGRTPMQWANEPNAGFSPPGVQTWLPVNPNYAQGVNVADQTDDPDSMLNFYRRLLHLRRQTPALISGDYEPLDEAEAYLAFLRRTEQQRCLVVLNMSDQPHTLNFDLQSDAVCPLFSSRVREDGTDNPAHLTIAPFEIYIAELA